MVRLHHLFYNDWWTYTFITLKSSVKGSSRQIKRKSTGSFVSWLLANLWGKRTESNVNKPVWRNLVLEKQVKTLKIDEISKCLLKLKRTQEANHKNGRLTIYLRCDKLIKKLLEVKSQITKKTRGTPRLGLTFIDIFLMFTFYCLEAFPHPDLIDFALAIGMTGSRLTTDPEWTRIDKKNRKKTRVRKLVNLGPCARLVTKVLRE